MTDFSVPMPPYSSIKRSTKRIRPKKHAQVRVGKVTSCIRLSGKALEELRFVCWVRDDGRCQRCFIQTYYEARFDGDPLAYDMAHIIGRGAGGSDTLDNVRTLCHRDHMTEHSKGK